MENRPILPQSAQTTPVLVETVGGEPRYNLVGAIVGGAIAALAAAALWGAFVAFTGLQIGFIGIVVGFIVGVGVKLGGRGANLAFGVVAAIFALGATVLGNMLVAASRVSTIIGVSFLEVFSPGNFSFVLNAFTRSFEVVDLLFYGLAVYGAFSAASREGARGIRS